MICPKDVLQWFKTLESYNRIDTMCSLFEACLPFELRFLGTFLEELGRRDSPELRGMELRANNPQDLAADMHNCQKGEPTDKKIRRKMALYLALIRACNRNCVTEIFRTLECWGERDFASINDQDTILELLLVYTMAAKHPVFSYHQNTKCGEILAKIKEIRRMADETSQIMTQQQQQQSSQQQQQQPSHTQHLLHQQQQSQPQPPPPFHHPVVPMMQPQQPTPLLYPQPWTKVTNQLSIRLCQTERDSMVVCYIIYMNCLLLHLKCLFLDPLQMIPGTEVDSIQHLMQSNITIPTDSNAIAAAAAAAAAAGGWSMRNSVPCTVYAVPPPQPQSLDHQVPPQASSPMLSSQQSSPSTSRTTSPQRERGSSAPLLQQQQQQPQQQMRSLPLRLPNSVKHSRRPSVETTPPPTSTSVGSGDAKHFDEVGTMNHAINNSESMEKYVFLISAG